MTSTFRLSVVVGVQHATANLPDILRALRPEAYPDVEFLFCHTTADPDGPALVGSARNVRAILGAPGSLIPHLWRDGILAASGERVATTTAHCVPAEDWVDTLLAADLDGAAIGGSIDNAAQAGAKAEAIYLLRYSSFAPPQARRVVHDLAADNAVYRRADILRHRALLGRGFWEPSFHDRFRAAGMRIEIDPRLRVILRNQYTALQFIHQRLAHGREFGFARGITQPKMLRLLLVLAAPAVFLILLLRILGAAKRNRLLRRRLVRAWFWLPVFTAAWATGEAWGYAASLAYRQPEGTDL